MPLVAILVAGILLDLAVRGTEHEFAKQLEQDFAQSEFWAWAVSLWIIGAIGSVKELRAVSNYALALVIVVLILKNGAFFDQAKALLTNLPKPASSVPLSAYPNATTTAASSSGGGGGGIGKIAGLVGGAVATVASGGAAAPVLVAEGAIDTGAFTT